MLLAIEMEILTWNIIRKCKSDLLYAQNSVIIIARELLRHGRSVTEFNGTVAICKTEHSVHHVDLYG
jgi:hypothetical protein